MPTTTPDTKPPLTPIIKWAGGKRQLLGHLTAHQPATYNTYHEPFIGAGALLLHNQPTTARINDTNPQLTNLYIHIRDNPHIIISTIHTLDAQPATAETYRANRTRYNHKITTRTLDAECAALLIWINKHCYNGLYRVNSKGLFNTPYNNNNTKGTRLDETNLYAISDYLDTCNITITTGDFEDACQTVQPDDFVYLDSPYLPESATADFTAYTKTGFTLDDHRRLAQLYRTLDAQGAKLMLSNNNTPYAHTLYKGYNIVTIPARRNINRDGNKRNGTEIIVTNY